MTTLLFGGNRSHDLPSGHNSFRTAGGTNFSQPTFGVQDDYIHASEYLYEWAHDLSEYTYQVKRADDYFRIPRGVEHGPAGCRMASGQVYRVPPTIYNLKQFVQLPMVPPRDKTRAMELILRWEHTIRVTCTTAIMLKAAEPEDPDDKESRHRIPVIRDEKKTVRPLTQMELMAQTFGHPVPSEEQREETSLVSRAFEDATRFQKYSHRRLFSQQLIGCWAIYHGKRVPLWYDMRVGKTDTALAVAKALLAEGKIDRVLVVCPVSNMYDPWEPEARRYHYRTHVLDGSTSDDEEAIAYTDKHHGHNLYVVNYERVHSRLEVMVEHWDMSRTMIVADETSAIKNPVSRRSGAMHKLCAMVEYITLLNGTPMEQGPQDLWSQMKCVDPEGVVWGHSFSNFADSWLEIAPNGRMRVKKGYALDFEMLIATTSVRYIRSEADQFAGKDKEFRYIGLPATPQMINDSREVAEGFIKILNGEAPPGTDPDLAANKTACILSVYLHLREITCGYNKFKVDPESSVYIRQRYKVDPKMMWLHAFISANPTQPLVIFCEFTEEEQAIKEMLDSLGIKWSSTRPSMRRKVRYVMEPAVPVEVYQYLVDEYWTGDNVVPLGVLPPLPSHTQVNLPSWVCWDEELCKWVESRKWDSALGRRAAECLHKTTTYDDPGPYGAYERSQQVSDFNRGDTHVFILKHQQGRGISLHRKEAVENGIGTWPSIIFMNPTWSLGSWDQCQDRCVVTDPKTGKNVCTMIYALGIKGSIEDKVLTALRQKKEVQAMLLQDAKRDGYSSFVESLVDGMVEAMADAKDFFDPAEYEARIECGVPPYSKLTESLIYNKVRFKYGKDYNLTSKKAAKSWVDGLPEEHSVRQSVEYLLTKMQKEQEAK